MASNEETNRNDTSCPLLTVLDSWDNLTVKQKLKIFFTLLWIRFRRDADFRAYIFLGIIVAAVLITSLVLLGGLQPLWTIHVPYGKIIHRRTSYLALD